MSSQAPEKQTHEVQKFINLFCTAAGSLSWTCFTSQTHAISLCFVSTQRYIYVCMRAGVLPLDSPKLNLVNKRHHGRGVFTKASQGMWMRLASG